jgi:sulfur carrier protein
MAGHRTIRLRMADGFMEPRPSTSRVPLRADAPSGDNGGMDILLNGQPRRLPDAATTVAALLHAEGLGERRVAVEVNGEIVPRGVHATRALQPGDRVEIVHALGGG